jgi:molybdopterin synthase catalytic subunit
MAAFSVTVGDDAIDAAALLAAFGRAATTAGAIASFAGVARRTGLAGESLDGLVLTGYRGVTLTSMQAIMVDARARFALDDAMIHHRIGRILPGETIVFVAATAGHRRPALEAVDYLMDRLKSDAVLWKYEESGDARRWIEPRADDAAALERWS